MKDEYDIVVVGAGTSGTFAAGTAADRGLDVALLERKSEESAGHVACGDAVHNPLNSDEFPGPFDMEEVAKRAGADTVRLDDTDPEDLDLINRGLYWDEELGVKKEVDFSQNPGNVVDRYEWGQALVDQAEQQGAEIHFDTVVNDVIQDERVKGVRTVRDGEPVDYRADLVIDAAGALSIVQDKADFNGLDTAGQEATFEGPHFEQFGSAYREIVETSTSVPYDDAIVVKPLQQDVGMGYFWYFPRDAREINVGLGFQMTQPPVKMIDEVRQDLDGRPEYENAELKQTLGSEDKLGSALGLRRPLDSMVAPGYIAVGDAAGMVSPTTGKGITGAAISGHSAGKTAVEAVSNGDVSEDGLWPHNEYIFSEHGEGSKLVKQDVFNRAGEAFSLDELRGAVALLPVDPVMDAISGSDGSYSKRELAGIAAGFGFNNVKQFLKGKAPLVDGFDQLDVSQRRANRVIAELYGFSELAEELGHHYSENYPSSPGGFDDWKTVRDELDARIDERAGVDPKY